MVKPPNTNPNDQWLIKSANRVMGPFKIVEVITGLQLKHFTVMDEIAAPFGRWVLVRDEQVLQGVVKDIRNRADTFEHTSTMTHSMTHSMTGGTVEESLVDVPPPIPGSLNPNLLKDKKLLEQVQSRSLNKIIGVIVVLALVSGLGFYLVTKKRTKELGQDAIAQALLLKSQGLYDKAYAQFAKLKATEKENPQLDMEMAIYQIGVQKQNAVGRKTLERVMPQLDKALLADAQTAIALSYLNDNDLKNASEANNKALAINSASLPALLNRAFIDFRFGNIERADQDFEPLMTQTNNGTVLLGSALASLEVARKGGEAKQMPLTLIQSIDEYLKNNFEYEQELYVLKAYIYSTVSKTKERQEAILQLLNSDFESGQNHHKDLLVDQLVLNWSNLLQYCQMTVESASHEIINRSFLAFCFAKAGREMEAKKIVVEAEAEAPRNPHLSAVKAFLMRSMGQDGEARASLGISLGEREILSSWLLKSRYCELDHDDNCMRGALNQLLDISPRSLPAYVAMARLELRSGNKKAAMDWIARGQNLSQTYVPFWEIKSSF